MHRIAFIRHTLNSFCWGSSLLATVASQERQPINMSPDNHSNTNDSRYAASSLVGSVAAFVASAIVATARQHQQRRRQRRNSGGSAKDEDQEQRGPSPSSGEATAKAGRRTSSKATRLVRYLSENHSESWRSYSNDEELFVQEFPKIELHVHFDGTFDPDFLWRYMQEHPDSLYCLPVKADLPWEPSKSLPVRQLVEDCDTPSEFHKLCTCRSGYRSLAAMLNCFEIFMPLVRRNLDLIEQLAFDFCQRQWEQNTIYTEVRYSPHVRIHTSLSNEDAFRTLFLLCF